MTDLIVNNTQEGGGYRDCKPSDGIERIPRIIHYVWMGKNPLTPLAEKCIASWKKFCPDYQIIEWNENNFDVNYCAYTREAYDAKKWAFVADVVRFKVVYDNGGLYFDTDVELIKNIDDIVSKGAFMANDDNSKVLVSAGLGIGAAAKNPIYREILDYYESKHFIDSDGKQDTTTVVQIVSDILKSHGYNPVNFDTINKVSDILIYPRDYFSPINFFTGKATLTENTVSIHYFDASWWSEESRYWILLSRKIAQKFHLPGYISERIAKYIMYLKFHGVLYTLRSICRSAGKKLGLIHK